MSGTLSVGIQAVKVFILRGTYHLGTPADRGRAMPAREIGEIRPCSDGALRNIAL
jgi:hypothetical protein